MDLWALWRRGHLAEPGRRAATLPVPGALSLRCRCEALRGGGTAGRGASEFDLSEALWQRQLELFDWGDQALRRNDIDAAVAAFEQLAESHREGHYPIAMIDARIGLGDAHRQADRLDAAIGEYSGAIAGTRACGYGYGQVRAGIPLGYLLLRSGSAAQAAEQFEDAARVAADNDWRLDIANAHTGLGEAFGRIRRPMAAMRALLDSVALYEELRSGEGVANATVQLGELCRRNRWLAEAAGWYRQAITAARAGHLSMALTNALDGLAEVQLGQGDRVASVANHQAAYEAAGAGNARGRAHALNGLGRCAVNAAQRDLAIRLFGRALQLYLSIDDLTSAATSEAGIARGYEAIGVMEQAVRHRVSAVTLIETMRAAQIEHAHQSEYYERFGTVHEMAVRTAIRAGDPAAFVAVFEAMAGRRLAGLMTAAPENTADERMLAQLLLEANSRAGQRRDRTRTLGGLALRVALPQLARQGFDDSVAGLYSPFDPNETENLWSRIDTGAAYLLLVAALREPDELAWLLRPPEGPLHIGLHDLPASTRAVFDGLHSDGLPLDATPSTVAALDALMPQDIAALIPRDEPLVIVPVGRLWAVPWTAVPITTGEYLGERNPLCLSPSLTSVAHTSGGGRRPPASRVAHWTSPLVNHHHVAAYEGRDGLSVAAITDASACRNAILDVETDLVVVVAHGRPVRELVHYLELDEHTALTPADMLRAVPPPALILISCWGAHAPDRGSGDPMAIATLALARGAYSVAATTSEMLDDSASSAFVNQFLSAAAVHPMPHALLLATRRWLARPEYRAGFLSRWAPLVTLCSW
ncbi:CHAT domain-containing protein [Nocardia sp. NPDC056611]|uniref:CHAT domain-containing tetratricopeptide repeat protein n=1 Tax=Nocardia sp. NPDC056611 TaxID=3345877 RepID=UPI003672902A